MTDWKSTPHLFCNGEFKVLYDMGGVYKFTAKLLGEIEEYGKYSHFTLIARPIVDLTDEEALKLIQDLHPNATREYLDRKVYQSDPSIGGEGLTYKEFEFLNDRGIYHLPQSHFGDSVINANEIEEV